MLESLEEGLIDFAISVYDSDLRSFKSKILFEDEFILVRSPRRKARLPADDLIICVTQKPRVRRFFSQYEKKYGKKIEPKLTIRSWAAAKSFALHGVGTALVPRCIVKKELRSKKLLEIRHRLQPIPNDICTLQLSNRELPRNANPLLKIFVDTLRNN